MKIEKTSLDGVLIITPDVFKDSRGEFQEIYNIDRFKSFEIRDTFIQDNHSQTKLKNTIRGLHFQNGSMSQSKLVQVIKGTILDVIVDINPKSKTYKKHIKYILDDQDHRQVYIPRGYAHGYRTLTDDSHVFYKVDNLYSSLHYSGIMWNDDELKIDWECSNPILSEQDTKWPKLQDLRF